MTETPKERPILFSAEMVRAILERRKTQTRRVIGLAEINKNPDWHSAAYQNGDGDWVFWYPDRPGLADFTLKAYPRGSRDGIKCPYGKPGDLLWVRETFGVQLEPDDEHPHGYVIYRADLPTDSSFQYEGGGSAWRPSIFMPRWASRITLEITNVSVERLHDISEKDCNAEGVPYFDGVFAYAKISPMSVFERLLYYQGKFKELWDSINAKRGYPWDSNPWVWVVEFVSQNMHEISE